MGNIAEVGEGFAGMQETFSPLAYKDADYESAVKEMFE
jgi:hypothetical protein